MITLEAQVQFTTFGDKKGVADRLRHFRENRRHLLRAAQIKGVTAHAHTVGVAEHTTSLNGKQNVLEAGISAIDVMHIVGGNKLGLVTPSKVHQYFVDVIQLFNIVLLEFEKEIVRPEDLIIPIQLAPSGG